MAKRLGESLTLYKVLSIGAILLAVVAVARPYFSSGEPVPFELIPIEELSTQGYTKVDVQVDSNGATGLVIVRGGCYEITANTELSQVESISNGQQGKVGYRPNSHDLMRDVLNSFDVQVVMVKIVDLQNSTYYGKLILKQDDRLSSLDSRPSDGIAIAVRTGAPIYMKNELLETGKNIC